MKDPVIPFYPHKNVFAASGQDCFIYDENGKEYLDLDSGVWCVNLGHCHPEISEVIERQSKELVHHGYSFRNRWAEELAERLLARLDIPGGQSVFLSSGSEAVNLAITMARRITGKEKVLTIDRSYLSAYGHAQQLNPNQVLTRITDGDTDKINALDLQQYSCFVFEPGTAWGRVIFPDKEFVEFIAGKMKKAGGLVLVDEVTTGFGRTGRWFGAQHYNLAPDMVVTGKGMGNGYPVSAVSISHETCRLFEKDPFRYAQSHQNDPLGCAVALKVMEIMENDHIIEESREKGEYFLEGLRNLKERNSGKITEVRGRGLKLAVEFAPGTDTAGIHDKLFREGFVAGLKENVIRFMPPLTIRKDQIDRTLMSLDSILRSFRGE